MCGVAPLMALPALPAAKRPPDITGNDGIAITGREQDYATALWLEGPSAFWLHPEGPLSDTTLDEWRAARSSRVLREMVGHTILSADSR